MFEQFGVPYGHACVRWSARQGFTDDFPICRGKRSAGSTLALAR
jgi:hypothetical protein